MLRALFKNLGGQRAAAPPLEPAPEPAAVAAVPAARPDAAVPADPYAASQTAQARGDAAAAEAILRDWVREEPGHVPAWATLGAYLIAQERAAEAAELLARGLERYPAALPLLMNMGAALQADRRLDQAIVFYRLAIAADPAYAAARFQLATVLLVKGEYREGFLLLRARGALDGAGAPQWTAQIPRWEGQSLDGKRLLIWLDWGGLGDELQFARYLLVVKQRYPAAMLCLGCSPESLRLLEQLPAVGHAFAASCDLAIDYQIPLLDLPCMFGTTVDTVPSPHRYLAAIEGDRRAWAARLVGMDGLKVGLCWTSGFWGRSQRSPKSIPLELLAPLAEITGLQMFSLQKGPARADIAACGMRVHDYDESLGDLADTAALIENLDLVISVDTAVAHLAGALGKPVLMLLRAESGNFWLLDTESSPWYASMRIVRQSRVNDWTEVAQQALQMVRAWPTWADRPLPGVPPT
jgi:tetratricopeptide (TPR) repeat protein